MANDPDDKEEATGLVGTEELLTPSETWWRDHYDLLETHGYRLRPRYHPDWVPSWKTSGKEELDCEDNILNISSRVIDATRISDEKIVTIKRVKQNSQEISIALFLSPENDARNSAQNHCVPVLDHFGDSRLPEYTFLVMPVLRHFDDPYFFSVNEVVDFIRQTLEGLCYMHSRGVAHRDCAELNIMLDGSPLYPHGFHPVAQSMDPTGLKAALKRRRRDVKGVKYYFIDFGISTRFEDDVSPEDRRVTGADCQDPDVPELSTLIPYDPFAVDVFILGNVYRKVFLDRYVNLSFLSGLVGSMTARKPDERPSANEALAQFCDIISKQHGMMLRWRLKERQYGLFVRVLLDIGSIVREGTHTSKRLLQLPFKLFQRGPDNPPRRS